MLRGEVQRQDSSHPQHPCSIWRLAIERFIMQIHDDFDPAPQDVQPHSIRQGPVHFAFVPAQVSHIQGAVLLLAQGITIHHLL